MEGKLIDLTENFMQQFNKGP